MQQQIVVEVHGNDIFWGWDLALKTDFQGET